jgi:peroxiredoxin Q/BCP
VLKQFDIVLFMASTDDAATNRKFAEANQATFPVLADPDKAAAGHYGVLTLGMFASRWTFYIDPEGRVAYVDKNVTPLSAGKDMVERLQQLGVPSKQ